VAEVLVYQRAEQDLSLSVLGRGHHVVYRANEMNRCPGCGRAHWHVGRQTAECGFCGTAVPLADAHWIGTTKAVPSGSKSRAQATSGMKFGRDKGRSRAEQRQHTRRSAAGRTLQLLIDGSPHSFALHNISDGGVMGDDPIGLREGAIVQVRLEDGTLVPAEVRWVEGSLIGVAFTAP
jgi:hypothetical protein